MTLERYHFRCFCIIIFPPMYCVAYQATLFHCVFVRFRRLLQPGRVIANCVIACTSSAQWGYGSGPIEDSVTVTRVSTVCMCFVNMLFVWSALVCMQLVCGVYGGWGKGVDINKVCGFYSFLLTKQKWTNAKHIDGDSYLYYFYETITMAVYFSGNNENYPCCVAMLYTCSAFLTRYVIYDVEKCTFLSTYHYIYFVSTHVPYSHKQTSR